MTETRPAPTTTDAGTPAPSDEFSQSVGPNGPLLLQDHYLIRKMAHFNRERVPVGSADTVRDPRGFAVRFSTEDGNDDIVGNRPHPPGRQHRGNTRARLR